MKNPRGQYARRFAAKMMGYRGTLGRSAGWVRSEIRRLDAQCKKATTERGRWYCLGKRAGLRTVLRMLTDGKEDGRE